MKLALYQGSSCEGDLTAAFDKIEQMTSAASAAGASMIVFPELFLPGYNQLDLLKLSAQSAGDDWERRLSEIARNQTCSLTIGWPERDGNRVFNAATTIAADGSILARHRKLQLFGPDERSVFNAGSDYTIFNLDGFKAALLICYDIEFAQHSRHLAQQGVELVLVPTANGHDHSNVPKILVPARALENGITIVYANFSGVENDLTYSGGSVIVGPDGNILAQAGNAETLLVAEALPKSSFRANALSTQIQDFRKLT